ncbi:Hypothetical_protein [Hexamita inflata]|uniref:Hypothetical_protein n=1 Tax=Hexamita inflata TaxID=28002 RepID=A0ABP1HBT4_9EUKA
MELFVQNMEQNMYVRSSPVHKIILHHSQMKFKLVNSPVSLQMFLEMASTLLNEVNVLEIPRLISILPNRTKNSFWVQMSYYLNAAVPDLKCFFEENINYKKTKANNDERTNPDSYKDPSLNIQIDEGLDCLMDFYKE